MDVLSVFKNSGKDALTMSEYLNSSESLEAQAREAAPWKSDECTFYQGHVRQPVFSCLTCKDKTGLRAGICATCSIACHADHEQVELFSRRSFQCDCGTTRLGPEASCSVGKRLGQPSDDQNKYDANFDNIFCICGRTYDPETEEDEMLQCVGCENWLHSKCVLPTKSVADGPSPKTEDQKDEKAQQKDRPSYTMGLDLDDFDSLVCAHCATKSASKLIWDKYAGRKGMMLVDDDGQVYGKLSPKELDGGKGCDGQSQGSPKKEAADKAAPEGPPAKKVKVDPEAEPSTASPAPAETVKTDTSQIVKAKGSEDCSAPEAAIEKFEELAKNDKRFAASIFMQEGWRERFCQCAKCLPMFKDFPFLLEEEEDVDLAEDDEPVKSISEIADQHLNSLPRAQAAEFSDKIAKFRQAFVSFANGLPRNQDGSDVMVDRSMVENWMGSL